MLLQKAIKLNSVSLISEINSDVLRDTEYKIIESLLFGYTLFTEFDNKNFLMLQLHL